MNVKIGLLISIKCTCRADDIGSVVDLFNRDVTRDRVAVDITIVDCNRNGSYRRVRVFAGIGVCDAANRSLVFRKCRGAGQSPRATGGVVRATNAVLVGEVEDVLAAVVTASDLNDSGFDIRVVNVCKSDGRCDRNRAIILGIC